MEDTDKKDTAPKKTKTDSKKDKIKKENRPIDLSYDAAYVRHDASCRYMEEIHEMAVTGKSISGAMGTQMPMPNWDDILLLGAQLNPAPLNDGDPVITTTVIGKNAKNQWYLTALFIFPICLLAHYHRK